MGSFPWTGEWVFRQRQRNRRLRALAGPAVDLHLAIESVEPLFDALKAEVPFGDAWGKVGVEAVSVVLDGEDEPIALDRAGDPDGRGLAMPDGDKRIFPATEGWLILPVFDILKNSVNRILFEPGEITGGTAVFGGERAEHVLKVLHGEIGQTLKTGVVGGKVGTAVITAVEGDRITVEVDHSEAALPTWVDLVLAPPRPRVMKRLLPQLAALGAGRIVLVGAKKVEKDFWGATLLAEKNYRPLFVDGLMQSGTSELPTLEIRRNFRKFVREKLDSIFPTANRVVAHPSADGAAANPPQTGRLLLAIGPEGGWTDEEVALLEEHGFARYSLGRRILRTDTATVALLAKLNTEDK
jgi:16S rRNA (uracil1498-N3)-methyltransferase